MLQAKARAPYSLVGRRVILYSFVPFLFISSADAQDKINYTDQILALVEANCAKCHNSDKKKADLDLTSYQGALKGSVPV